MITSQLNFMSERSIENKVFEISFLMEKYHQKKKQIIIDFVDLKKAYDKVQ